MIEYLGRTDGQVKVRGCRIELGEVEASLRQHPAVRDAAAAVVGSNGDARLVGYLVSRNGPVPAAALRDHLKGRLPEYMVPSAFVPLDALPLTPSGKLDRKALPLPNGQTADADETSVGPRTPTEEAVAAVWAEVLRLQRVGAQDNFFDLGGHSLVATQVVARLRDIFQTDVSLPILFEHPTVSALAGEVERRRAAGDAPQQPPLMRVDRDDDLPVSFAQQRLWFLDQWEPESALYNIAAAVRLAGPLKTAALAHSLWEILRRHEVLRSTFSVVSGRPVSVVADEPDLLLAEIDLSDLPDGEREAHARFVAEAEARRPFDLAEGPLLRASLLRLAPNDHVAVVVMHHIASDGWSFGVFKRELAALYESYAVGRRSPLPELPVQYADYAAWQRRWLRDEALDEQIRYWKERLAGARVLDLPADRPRPAARSYRGATLRFALPPEMAETMRGLARREGCTPFMVLLAAFQTVLQQYSGQDDICVGTPVAGRGRPELDRLIGFFVNTLVLRTDLSGEPTFRDLLARVRETCLGAYARQDLPFERLVEELKPDRDPGRTPFFQVMFVLQNTLDEALELPGLDATPWNVDSGTSKFDLTLRLTERDGGLQGELEYSTDLFDEATVARLAGHYGVLLEAACRDAGSRVSELPLLTAGEREDLSRWNSTGVTYPQEHLLHRLIAEQVRRTPDAEAVRCEGQALTYAELDRRAAALAGRLRRLGVGPDVPVGVCLDRSCDLVVALYGVLKAGGCYVPLDPDYPAERLAFMLADAAPPVVLAHGHLAGRLPRTDAEILLLDDGRAAAGGAGDSPPPATDLTPDRLAYVIYTSGSTGTPKGAANTHRGICNRLLWMQDEYRLGPADTVLQKTPCSFDVSVWEFFWPLLSGARLVLARPGGHKDPAYLAQLIRDERVTVCHFVPSMLEAFLREPGLEGGCGSLRDVVCSGEALSYGLQERFFARLPGRLHNLYGPTEAAVDVTYWQCRRGDPRHVVPIGRPIANVQMHVLDRHGHEVPVGVPGELYIGGAGLARGYHDRPELTAERFVDHPELGRLYRTGDVGRWLADGVIEYLGRTDGQVKVRGCRIELGEVEASLRQHPAVRDAAAAVVGSNGDARLVGYLVPKVDAPGADGHAAAERQNEQVSQWRSVWEDTYGQDVPPSDTTFNTVGWNSSYTGLPIPEPEMREWREHTVERIAALAPSRLLEIGCGSGLLLFQLAPGCAGYTGLDFSQGVVRSLERQLSAAGRGLPQVRLLNRAAHELDDFEAGAFDTVVLNSVVQYFPDVEYLVRVLEAATRLVRSGGRIFLGDVRNYRLLAAFHAAVQLHKAPATLSREQLRARVHNHARQERELLVDPDFFAALRQHLPRISRVDLRLKRGRHHNEMTRFRYDVVLHVEDAEPAAAEPEERDWQESGLTVAGVGCLLQNSPSIPLRLSRVPNARVWADMKALELLDATTGPATAHDLREALRAADPAAIDPEEFWALGRELGHVVEVAWSVAGGDGCYDVTFRRPAPTVLPSRNGKGHSRETVPPPRPWASYANDPLRVKAVRDLVPQLRDHLKGRLPEFMVPAAFVVVDGLPLTPSGKLDRKALPAPDTARPELEEAYVAPRTPTEQTLADLWAEVLGVERVGVADNFFELGGHSLLATQVVSRLRKTFQVELALRALFEAPTVAGLAERIEEVRRAALGLPAAPLRPVPRDGELPLSFGQETFWFLDQLEPGSPVFNVTVDVRLRGPIDLAAAERALNAVLRRHDVLRTTCTAVDGRPVAVIAPPAEVSLPLLDLTNLPEGERETEARRVADEEARLPFDLAHGPLFRVRLLRLGAEDHVGLLTAHHSIYDGWSQGLFVREVGLLYQAFRAGEQAPLPDLLVQYVDFAHWQRQWLKSGLMEGQLAYWKKQLGGKLPVLELPADHPRPAARTFRGARQMMVLSPTLTAAVNTLSRREGCTLYMTLLAAFQALLARYTGQEDVCVGSPIAGRNRAETEALIGFFVNTLVLRTDLSGDPSFRDLLARVREVALGAFAHQDLPFEMLVQSLRPDRDLSHPPLFQVMFILQNAPLKIPRIAGLTAGQFVELADNGTSKFDVTLTMIEGPDGLTGTVEYNTDLFEEATIRRLMCHYQTLLEAVVSDPDLHLSRLPLLTPTERQQLAAWNETAADYPVGECINELFEAQVERTPDALAVVGGDRRLTYAELNRLANRLANRLRGLGIGPESLVGLYLDRTPDLLVGVLGILKAGGAYVPLDPAYPGERLAAVIADAGFAVLLTDRRPVSELPASDARVICLDDDTPDAISDRDQNPGRIASANNLAYVIYTSGSTGRPKGAMLTHAGLCNAYRAWEDAYRLRTDATSHLQMASCAFDVFAGDWTRALCSGGKLVLCPREALLDPPRLYDLMRRERVDAAEFVPAVLRGLVQHLESTEESLEFMRLLVAGSDVWYAGEYRRIRRLCGPRTRLINSYGLTEATIDSSYFEAADLDLPADRAVPIGRPFANSQLHVLDRHRQPVPVGVPGELHIGGVGLARGYFRQPELTEQKFVPDPFSGRPGARLFCTGDLARYRPDGSIELLGRTDDQVKIRGFRIEPGEIEAALGQYPAVRQAVVVARGDSAERKHLVAYVSADGPAPAAADLRGFLREKLPDYMVPAAFVVLDALPLSPNGKVDRQALPDVEPTAVERRTEFVAPRTPTEEVVADVWQKVLGVERVGVLDNFFELGGHSLLATQVVSRLAQAAGADLPVRSLFEAPTVAELAERVEIARRAGRSPKAPAVRRRPQETPPPLSFGQQRLWFLDRFEPGSPFYNIASAARLTGELDVTALDKSLHEIVRRHEALRTVFREVDGQPVQVVVPDVDLATTIVDLSSLAAAEREPEAHRLARHEAQRPFDLTSGPLLRTLLVKLAPHEHVVLVVVHHIVADGWSLGVFFREMATLYRGFVAGDPVRLPELPVQYADYAVWQRDWLRSEVLERQLAYWKERLAGAPAALELPTDRPRPPIQTVRGGTEPLLLPRETLCRLQTVCQKENCTPFMALAAAFQSLLHRYTGQEDFCLGTPIANRTRPELEGLIGIFVNTLVLRADLSGDPTFRELLGRVRESCLGAYAHQDLPFEMLVEALQPQRDLSRTPLFQVMFALQNAPLPAASLPGLRLSPVEADSGTAKFDLSLELAETEQGLAGRLEYNADLFDTATARRLLDHFRNLLEAAVADPGRRLSELPLLTESERRQILTAWNATDEPIPAGQTVTGLFEAQVERTPEAVAVVFDGEQVTYRELNVRANRLAHHLRDRGVGPDVLVGICLERSVDLVVGLLGVLKAGGAYVPLDPAYPSDRLTFMLRDSGARLVLTDEALALNLSAETAALVCPAAMTAALARQSADNPPPAASPDDLAYVIYTSGSTGRPKGVQISQGAVVNFLASMRRRPGLTERDTLLAVTTLSFDIAGLEIFLPLSVGARVELVSREVAQDGARLAETLAVCGATVMQATPATWRLLLAAGWAGGPGLKILCGGEAISPELAQQLLARGAAVWNLYGPTETTIWSTVHQVDGRTGPVPIGRPIANTRVYVVDGRGRPVPVGVTGELLIGGVGVARGYLGRPELTAEKFIQDPFGGVPGARLYRTGDLARWLPTGELECLGRVDHQVKIRGFRVEPGEIEVALRQHPEVQHAAVTAGEDGAGDKRLVAYLVPNPQQEGAGVKPSAEHVAHWQHVWDEAYARPPAPEDAGFHVDGWNSSYTGMPLDRDDMREWVDRTVERIGALRPSRVLEVGCGTGLLLFRLAPHCAQYTATDISEKALYSLLWQLSGQPQELPVRLLQRPADDFTGFGTGAFDAVVLNSVVQYFPGIDYLVRVLERAVRVTRPGGFVFVGDVRNLALLETFHASVQLDRAPAALDDEQFRRHVRKKAAQERELVIDPAFFTALKVRLPQIGRAEVQLKRGRLHNEMTTFRYDVILHVGADEPASLSPQWLPYRDELSPSAVRRRLEDDGPETLAIAGVPNARIPAAVRAVHRHFERSRTVGELRNEPTVDAGIDPEDFWALGDSLPYDVDVRWTAADPEGRFDVALRRRDAFGLAAAAVAPPADGAPPRPWATYANDPLKAAALQDLVPRLREHLKGRLPEYMVPSAFVVLDELPLTPNGKVDRRALPAAEQQRPDFHGVFVAPRNPTETRLAALWTEVLGLDRVGVHDNFFDLGGHSLQAAKLVGRVSMALQRDVPVKALFLHPTVASFAQAVMETAAECPTDPQRNGSASAGPARGVSELAALAPHVTLERRQLLPLFESGELAPVDAAAIGYLPTALLHYTGLAPREIIDGWCRGRPVVSGLFETPLGRIGLLLVPRFDSQVYHEPDDLLAVLGEAIRTAGTLGARTVSLTGLLPSATDYGRALRRPLAKPDGPRITTGHATTTAAVVMAVRNIVAEAGRDLTRERVGFLGLGSVGTATLRTLLRCLPHPAEIRLCDVYSKRDALFELQRELAEELGYRGPVHVLESRGRVPAGLYECSLLVGATNVPDVVDVDRLAPGTVLVDDSSPHCFRPDRAISRLRERHDLLFTEGGVLRSPGELRQTIYVPAGLERVMPTVPAELFATCDPHHITGCVLSGLLSARRTDLPPTVGLVSPHACLDHYRALQSLGFSAAGLQYEDYAVDPDAVREFRRRFGGADQGATATAANAGTVAQ